MVRHDGAFENLRIADQDYQQWFTAKYMRPATYRCSYCDSWEGMFELNFARQIREEIECGRNEFYSRSDWQCPALFVPCTHCNGPHNLEGYTVVAPDTALDWNFEDTGDTA